MDHGQWSIVCLMLASSPTRPASDPSLSGRVHIPFLVSRLRQVSQRGFPVACSSLPASLRVQQCCFPAPATARPFFSLLSSSRFGLSAFRCSNCEYRSFPPVVERAAPLPFLVPLSFEN